MKAFASISEISQALRLNLLQHYAFETYARHLLYLYTCDINDNQSTSIEDHEILKSLQLKSQLIGYVGGEAGTGKSAFVGAILTFATLWGRRATVETMAYMGLAGLNVDGDTIHSQRGINISYKVTRYLFLTNIICDLEVRAKYSQTPLCLMYHLVPRKLTMLSEKFT